MDIRVKVEERRSDLRRIGEVVRTLALLVVVSCATACGGGGGGGDGGGGGGSTPTGSLNVTVVEVVNGANVAIPDASVQAVSGGVTRNGTTAADGIVPTLNGLPAGSATVTVSRVTFTTQTLSQTITANQAASLTVVLSRDTQATGGVVETRVPSGGINPDASTMEFSVRVVVVDENSAGVDGLTESAFTLLPCTTNTSTPDDDCVRDPDDEDVGYTVLGPGNPSFEVLPGQVPPDHYAAALLFDQSRSIIQTDPANARLFAAKEFLNSLGSNGGGNDLVVVAAFARDINASPNGDCLLPACAESPPQDVTIYPYNPPTVASFTPDGTSYVATVDGLAELAGGGTPLYASIDRMLEFTRAADPPTDRMAVVVFTDGKQEPLCAGDPGCQTTRDTTIALSRGDPSAEADDVDIFTIGLAGDVDGIALAELADGGNGVFLFAEDAAQLIPIYGSLGNLLSGSLTTYRLRFRVQAPAGTFAVGNAVRGVIEVNGAADTTIRIPFIVRIF